MFIITNAAALLAIIFATIAAAFLICERRNILAALLAFYLISTAVWIGGNAAADVSYTPEVLILTSQFAFVGGVCALFFQMILVDYLVDRKFPSNYRIVLYALPTMVLCVLGFSRFAIVSYAFPPGQPAEIVPGIVYTMVLFALCAVFSYGLIRLFTGLRKEQNYALRMQLLYVLTGLLITVTGQIVFDVVLPLMGEVDLYSLGPLTSTFFAITCAVAITRHKLFDISILIQRSAIYTVLLVLIVSTYLILIHTSLILLGANRNIDILISAGITTVLGISTVPCIERTFRKLTDTIFFLDHYDYAEAVHTMSEILHTSSTLTEIFSESEHALGRILRSTSVHIVLAHSTLLDDSSVLQIPIRIDGQDIATVYIGAKRSGDIYRPRDKALLATFAYQAATAISRAGLYEEVREYALVLQAKVAERTEELRMAHESQRQMIVDIAHNLQTPLTVFQTKIESLKKMIPDDKSLAVFETSLSSLSGFIYDLLTLASLERIEPDDFSIFSITDLFKDIAEEVSVIAESNDILVVSSIEPDGIVHGNEKRIREALINITSNSLKYMREASDKKVEMRLFKESDEVCIQIKDTGIGISPEDIGRIFERCYRGQNVPTHVRGTGLGLAIVKRIIEIHGGTLSVESTLGIGSTFTVSLPLATSASV